MRLRNQKKNNGLNSQDSSCVKVSLEGGTGKATIESPAEIKNVDGTNVVVIKWSSPFYDYMLVDGVKYEPVNEEGNSVFEIPIEDNISELQVIADTVAMSKPHEIEYVIIFNYE